MDLKKAAFFLLAALVLAFTGTKSARADGKIKIDIPVKLKKADVVFDLSHPSFFGDMPVGLKYMDMLENSLRAMGTRGHVVGLFYGKGAYMALNDKAYDSFRKISTGNPYKGMIGGLIKKGARLEECAVSMKANKWGNADLLPGVKVDSGAVSRLVQLVHQGYVVMEP